MASSHHVPIPAGIARGNGIQKSAVAVVPEENIFEVVQPEPEHGVADPVAALNLVREDLGDCTRCKLHKQGRKQIVFNWSIRTPI